MASVLPGRLGGVQIVQTGTIIARFELDGGPVIANAETAEAGHQAERLR